MMTFKYPFLIALILTAAQNVEAEVKTATVDRLLQREFIANVLIDDEREQVYFERVDSRASSPGSYPYADVFSFASALKKIYIAPTSGRVEARPLFEQEKSTGYFFASDDPWSPGNRYIAIYRFHDGKLQPGVYDLLHSREKFFDVEAEYQALVSTLVWVSDNEFVVPDGDNNSHTVLNAHFGIVNGARALASVRESAWRDGKVTSEVVGVGKFDHRPVSRHDVGLVRINVQTGEVRRLENSVFSETELTRIFAPGKVSNFVAVFGEVSVKDAASNEVVSQTRLSIVDTSTGERKIVNVKAGERVAFHSWSGSGTHILIQRFLEGHSETKQAFSIVNAADAAIVRNLPEGASNPTWFGDTLMYHLAGEQVFSANTGRSSAARYGDEMASHNAVPSPVATSETGAFYLENGNLWHADENGKRTSLTNEYSESIARCDGIQNARDRRRLSLSLMTSSAGRGVSFLDRLVFCTGDGGLRQFITFSADGSSFASVSPPDRASQLLVASSKGAVFLTNSYETGSQLHYVRAGETGKPTVLYHFNKQLAGVTPAVGPIAVKHEGYDGRSVTGRLYLPPGASLDDPKQYPMVMLPYAGNVYNDRGPVEGLPAAPIWTLLLSSPSPTIAVEVFAAMGYAVLLPSIPLGERGSAGEPMTRMMPAVLSSLDAAIETGFVDPNRLALVGHSYGGYTALSVAVQTDWFQAIIASAPASNISSEYGQFAPHLKVNAGQVNPPGAPWTSWVEDGQGRMGSTPWQDPDRYVRNSPLFHADNVTTPVMLIHGGLDGTALAVNSEEMFTAFHREEKDAVFVRYVGEQHIILQTQNQRDMWKRIFSFMENNGVTPDSKTVH